MWNDFLFVNIDWLVVILLLFIYHVDVAYITAPNICNIQFVFQDIMNLYCCKFFSASRLIWSNVFIGNSLSCFLIQAKLLIQVEFWSTNLRSSTHLAFKSAIILWLDMKNNSDESVNLSIPIALFLTHCLTAFSWLLSQWSTTWLSLLFIFPFWFSWSVHLTMWPVCIFMVGESNSDLGCDKPPGINFDLEKLSWHEWVTFLLKNFALIATHASFWFASAASIVWMSRLIISSGTLIFEI